MVAGVAHLGQADLERQQEARQLAARGDPGDRRRRRAGIGGDRELHAVGAGLGPLGLGQRGKLGDELGLLELERPQLGRDRLVEPRRALAAAGGLRLGGGDIGGARGLRLGRQPLQPGLAVVERRQLGGELLGQGGQLGHRDVVLAGGGAQREQALLDLLQPRRVELQRIARRLELGLRLGRLAQRPVERGQRRIEPAHGLVDIALDQAMRRAQRARPRRGPAPARPAPGPPPRPTRCRRAATAARRPASPRRRPWAPAPRVPSPRGAGNPRRAARRRPPPRRRRAPARPSARRARPPAPPRPAFRARRRRRARRDGSPCPEGRAAPSGPGSRPACRPAGAAAPPTPAGR